VIAIHAAGFTRVLGVELFKLRRSLALWLTLVAPMLVVVFLFFNLLRMERATTWVTALQGASAIWAFFMLPMSVTALTALVAHTEHGPRSWETLRALPLPAWQLYAAKLVGVMTLVLGMSTLLAIAAPAALALAGQLNPVAGPQGPMGYVDFLARLGRIAASGTLLVVVQLWVALRFASFVPALALGIGGTFFAVVATSARVGVLLPWQIPINQMAADASRANLALGVGLLGGSVACIAMLWHLSRREVL
jgi:ABC-2 type transport system permease protein